MKKILCMGDVALDVIAQLKEQINYGNDTASKISTHPGGQAANVATWITRTNNKAVIVARVGNDPVGFALISDLDKYGVEHRGLMNSGRPSGVVVILVDSNGERTMFPDNGANADLEVSDLPPLDDIDGVYLSGYALLDFRSRDAALGMIKKFREKKIPIFFDPTTTGAMKVVPKSEILEWVGMVDGIVAALERINRDQSVRCAILTGSGDKIFCAGGDLKERNGMTKQQWVAQHELFERAYWTLVEVPVPARAAEVGPRAAQ